MVAQEFILIVTYLIYYKRQKNILIKNQIAILSSLISLILFIIDLWMICSIRSIEFESQETWAAFLTIAWCLVSVMALLFILSMKEMLMF